MSDDLPTYEKVESAFEKEPRRWMIDADALTVVEKGQSRTIPFADVSRITFRFSPTKFKLRRYVAKVESRSSWPAEIDSYTFKGVGDFEDRGFHYSLFMRLLAMRMSAAGTGTEVRTGSSPAYYAFAVLATALALFVALLTFFVGGPLIILIKVGLIIVYFPTMTRWFSRNVPRRGTVSDVPENGLPPLVD